MQPPREGIVPGDGRQSRRMTADGFLLTLLGIAGCLGFLVWRARQQLTLFIIRIERGRIIGIKGRIPRRLLGDIADVARQERCEETRVICRLDDGAAQLSIYGDTNPGFEQMLRNLLGEYPVARLKQAPRAARP